jgi:tetratricopeptide (TPR) repeat protein
VDARTAESHFKQADSLYRDGRYDEALDRLIELDEAFPNTPNVLFPLARCLRRLGRIEESLAICDDLITRCGDLRALGLREFIRKSHSSGTEPTPQPLIHSIEGLNQDAHVGVLDDLLGPPPELPRALPKPEDPKPYKKYALIGGGILLAAIVIVLLLVMRR